MRVQLGRIALILLMFGAICGVFYIAFEFALGHIHTIDGDNSFWR